MNFNYDSDLLSEFSETMVKERDEAIRARKQAGLDDVWQKAREQYQGIDEVNRDRMISKSATLDGPIQTTMGSVSHEKRSTVFVNITRPYTNAGVARVSDILLPTGGKDNWDLRPTPISELALLASFVAEHPEILQTLPEDLQAKLQQPKEAQEASIEQAKLLIRDWLTETNWHKHTRDQITEAGKVGTGVIKGPFAKRRALSEDAQMVLEILKAQSMNPELDEIQQMEFQLQHDQLEARLAYQPAIECIPVENLYPDMPSCGKDINNGRFVWEEIPDVSKLELQELANDPSSSYFPEALQQCLSEDPKPCTAKGETENKKKKSYTRWLRTGEIDLKKVMPEAEISGPSTIRVELEIINDYIVKINKPSLIAKGLGYHTLVWEPRQDSWAGIGIPEQIETPQRGLNASVRAGHDNMGWSVGFQVIVSDLLEPLKGNDRSIEPYKLWKLKSNSLAALGENKSKAADAFASVEFPIHLAPILEWINFWLQMAESTTGLSLLLQGQKSSDSVGVSQMLMNSSTTNLRMFVKHWDDDNCAPIIQDMYQWVQLYGPDEAKGDAVAHALGSSVLITRDLQQQMLVQLLDRFVQPVYGKSPSKGMDMILESAQFDPRQLDLDADERQRLEQAAAEPDPKVQVEQLRSETDRMIAQMEDQRERWETMLDAQLKGLSLDQANSAVEQQVAGSFVLEGIKQEGDKEKEIIKAEVNPKPKNTDTQPASPADLSVDQALDVLEQI